MADQSETPAEKRAPAAEERSSRQASSEGPKGAPVKADAVPEDPDRGGTAYWRERAGRLGTTPHHIVGALSPFPADATFAEDDVRELVREFSNREERPE